MSSICWAQITIPKRYQEIPAVAKAIDYESFEDSDEDDKVVMFSGYDASWGEYEDLEKVLVDNKVPFDRRSEEIDGCDPCIRTYRPEDGESPEIDETVNLTSGGQSYIIIADLKKIIDENSPEEALDKIKKLIADNDIHGKPIEEC